MIDYMTECDVWWVLKDERGRMVCETDDCLSTYAQRMDAVADAAALKSVDGIDLRPVKVRLEEVDL